MQQDPAGRIGKVFVGRAAGAEGVSIVIDNEQAARNKLGIEVFELGLGAVVGIGVQPQESNLPVQVVRSRLFDVAWV